MKFFLFSAALLQFLNPDVKAQSFYNGSFEDNSAAACIYTLSNIQFNSKLMYVTAFGTYDNGYNQPKGKTSLHDSGCYVVPQHGKWCVGLRGSFGPTYDAIALELTTPLDSGEVYYLSFYLYGNLAFHNFMMNVDVGESVVNTNFGNLIHSAQPDLLSWKNVSFSFTASHFSKYITVKITPDYGSWNQIDNFVISRSPIALGIEEQMTTDHIKIYPNPANQNITLQFSTPPASTTVQLYDALGKEVLREYPDSPRFSFNVSELPGGIYSVRVSNGQTTAYKKVIITNN